MSKQPLRHTRAWSSQARTRRDAIDWQALRRAPCGLRLLANQQHVLPDGRRNQTFESPYRWYGELIVQRDAVLAKSVLEQHVVDVPRNHEIGRASCRERV